MAVVGGVGVGVGEDDDFTMSPDHVDNDGVLDNGCHSDDDDDDDVVGGGGMVVFKLENSTEECLSGFHGDGGGRGIALCSSCCFRVSICCLRLAAVSMAHCCCCCENKKPEWIPCCSIFWWASCSRRRVWRLLMKEGLESVVEVMAWMGRSPWLKTA